MPGNHAPTYCNLSAECLCYLSKTGPTHHPFASSCTIIIVPACPPCLISTHTLLRTSTQDKITSCFAGIIVCAVRMYSRQKNVVVHVRSNRRRSVSLACLFFLLRADALLSFALVLALILFVGCHVLQALIGDAHTEEEEEEEEEVLIYVYRVYIQQDPIHRSDSLSYIYI